MMLLLEDTARNNLASWSIEVVRSGHAAGAIVSPFTTPRYQTTYKQSARQTVRRLLDEGAEAWLDPATHALQMPAVGDFRYYDDWPLWDGVRGRLEQEGDMKAHVERVYAEQDALGVPRLAPTILLHSAQSETSERALELAQIAMDTDGDARLSIAGDSAFWADGAALDAHIGALAQLEPNGWWLTVVRPLALLPALAVAEEIHGLCRTSRALAEEETQVHVSHGDLAALPAVAAGATSIGTGWDPRQRGSAYASYEERDASEDSGGQWFKQVTFEGLLSLIPMAEANVLAGQDSGLAARLLPGGIPPGPKEAYRHHVSVLATLLDELSQLDHVGRFQRLRARYAAGQSNWDAAGAALGTSSRADAWIKPFLDGLTLYGQTEGF